MFGRPDVDSINLRPGIKLIVAESHMRCFYRNSASHRHG